jgi:hypothetical protein
MKAWKNAEKQAAKLLGGIRRVRVLYSESVADVIHPTLAIEVKYGKQVPIWIAKIMRPTLVNGKYLITPWVYEARDYGLYHLRQKKIKFVEDGLVQASTYSTNFPVLVMKPKGYRGVILACYWKNLRVGR